MIIKYDYRINIEGKWKNKTCGGFPDWESRLTLEWSIKIIISFSDLNMCVYKCMYIGVCKYMYVDSIILCTNSIYILYINILFI